MRLFPFILVCSFFHHFCFSQTGQCLGGGCAGPGTSSGAVQSTTSSTFVNSVANTLGGRYNTYNVTAGQQYEWSLCPADGAVNPTGDAQLTLKNTSNVNICYSDDLCGAQPKILWTATFTGQVRVLVNRYNCLSNTNNHTVRWRCVSCAPTDPTSITSSSATLCSGQSVSLTANGAVGTVYWFSGACGTSGHIGVGTTINVSPTTTTTYYARNFDGINFSTNCVSQTIVVNPVPAVNAGSDATICSQGSIVLSGSSTVPTVLTNEGFDVFPPSGWVINNLSNPIGVINWFQGNPAVFTQQSGTGYIAANFNSTASVGTISNWLISPNYNLNNGDVISFYTRGTTGAFPDRLQVRLSTNGTSVNVGANETSVGDFTALLLEINPTLVANGYPSVWTQYTITISGLSGPTSGRVAFRYFVTNGGSAGANSDYIGIDNFTYATAPPISNIWSPSTSLSETNTLNPTANPSSTITYTLTATANGCSNSDDVTITVDEPSTAPTSIIGTGSYCHGNTVTLTQNGGTLAGASTYRWFTGSCGGTLVGSGPSISISPSSTETYYVRATANGTCPATTCASGVVTLPSAGSPLGGNNESATCVVTENNWIHFYHSSGRLLASVNSGGQNLGNVTVTSYVDGTNALVPACDYPTYPEYMTSVMQRHWVITPQFQPATPVQVRLPFYDTELTSLSAASIANSNIYDNVNVIGEVMLSKYSGPANVNASALDNCSVNGGSENTAIFGQSANGSTSTYSTVGSSSFVTYTIPGFSEFWLHGASNNSPLPIELSSFAAICNESADEVKVQWTTATENNTSHFDVERSLDGTNWELLGSTEAAGNSTIIQTYSLSDNDVRGHEVIYYRLHQFDQDGASEIYGPTSAECLSDLNGIELFPNPAGTEVSVFLNGEFEEGSQIIFTDMNGKEVKQIVYSEQNGKLLTVDLRNLEPGVYVVKVRSKDSNNHFVRLIKH